jgi:hypothetical protein
MAGGRGGTGSWLWGRGEVRPGPERADAEGATVSGEVKRREDSVGAWMGLGRGGIEPLCCLGMPSASIVRCAGGKTVNAAGSWKIMLHAS